MATLDFVQFIKDNASMTTAEQSAMLDDFCAAFGMGASKDFANSQITRFITKAVNRIRRRDATINQFELTDGTVVLP